MDTPLTKAVFFDDNGGAYTMRLEQVMLNKADQPVAVWTGGEYWHTQEEACREMGIEHPWRAK